MLSERSGIGAVMPVHLFGACADMDALLAMAGPTGIPGD
jgi:dTDP-4-amino-4,6-dideoxygalactose transaminase